MFAQKNLPLNRKHPSQTLEPLNQRREALLQLLLLICLRGGRSRSAAGGRPPQPTLPTLRGASTKAAQKLSTRTRKLREMVLESIRNSDGFFIKENVELQGDKIIAPLPQHGDCDENEEREGNVVWKSWLFPRAQSSFRARC